MKKPLFSSPLFLNSKNWRWALALIVIFCGFVGFQSGVEVSERNLSEVGVATKLYYTLGLFILGGMDIGVPVSGPWWGQVLLWIGYFGAPLLTGSTIVDWLQRLVIDQQRWLKKVKNHVILIGTEELSYRILAKLRERNPEVTIVIVERHITAVQAQVFTERFAAKVITGDFTNQEFLLTLRLEQALRVFIASASDFDNFEAASKILDLRPELEGKLVVHCSRLRFMRAMRLSDVIKKAIVFNNYHLAAKQLVKRHMLGHFSDTRKLDTVVIAGFNRFGQTILEELQQSAIGEVSDVVIIDSDVQRRILVTKEQIEISSAFRLHLLEGEIDHPQVWQQLGSMINLELMRPFLLLATPKDDDNLRTGLWLKRKYPSAKVMVRSARTSHFSKQVCEGAGIEGFAMAEIIYDSMPDEWFSE
ncbi:MAG: potassium transporter TrkA [Gammaproteobacteria bacterium]|nr:potassium transporter TrkA [Gammaproteobacteria bacterium]MBT5205360.1 potassium transporter TrkA [Gammaproteobacteria bacterium]MBT5603382.1 potassium transporter TrkA [Gammaproteobacteria bacterium]MBT6245503.1 potassium transporter TrkA [Gammaproteobacteria bacterium]